jgi:putative ABC transport system permease protein
MRALWAAGLLLRRLRGEPGVILLIVGLVAGTSFLFAAAPRLFNQVSDEALRHEIDGASSVQRNIQLAAVSVISAGPDGGISSVQTFGDSLERRFPASVESLVADRSLVVTTARFVIPDPPRFTTYVTLRYQDGMEDHTRLVEGRWPRDIGEALPPATIGLSPPEVDRPQVPRRFEIAISATTAEEIGAGIGTVMPISVDGADPLLARTFFRIVPAEVLVVGLYQPLDPLEDYWYGDASLLQISRAGSINSPVAFATAFFAADSYPQLVSSGLPFRYQWRFHLGGARLDASQLEHLEPDLRRMETDFVTGGSELSRPGSVVMRSGLLALIERYQAERSSTEAVLSIAAIGPFALAGGALGMVAILLITRRRRTLALARGRGASGRLVLGAELWEATVLTGAAALVGLVAALLVVPGRASAASPLLALGVAGAATALLVGATMPLALRPLGQLERDDPPALRVSPRRLVIEMTVVGIAVAGTLLLRQRGLTVGGSGSIVRFDPLLAAVPVLAGIAVGIIAMRLYPLPIRAFGWLAARRRDLVPVLGLRTVGRHPAAANLPLLVLMLTAAFGAFSSVIVTSIDRGQVAASWENVGADYRIEQINQQALGTRFDPNAVPGVEAVAPGMIDTTAEFTSTTGQRASIVFESIEPAGYAAVSAGAPIDATWPDPFLDTPPATPGTPGAPIPAILSRRLPVGSASLRVGDQFGVTVGGQLMTFEAVATRADFPGITADVTFVIAPFNWVQAAYLNPPFRPSALWIRAPADSAEALAAAVRRDAASARIVSRHHQYADLHDAPLVAAIGDGFTLALVVAAAYTALTIIGALTLSAARRTQDLAFLRTLGVTGRQALGLTVMEHGPPVLLALFPGIALGIAVAALLEPGLGLAAFVGSERAVSISVDWRGIGLMALALSGVVVAAVGAGTIVSRRAHLVDSLRIGDD